MARLSVRARKQAKVVARVASCRIRGLGFATVLALALAGCTGFRITNPEPAQELARLAQPPGKVYTGWRVFQDKCAACHGPTGSGTATAPDLLPKVRAMGLRQFVAVVVRRYDWGLPAGQSAGPGAAGDALVDDVVQRRQGALAMPEWQGEPRVAAHIADLHAYLSARAEGIQGPGRPAP